MLSSSFLTCNSRTFLSAALRCSTVLNSRNRTKAVSTRTLRSSLELSSFASSSAIVLSARVARITPRPAAIGLRVRLTTKVSLPSPAALSSITELTFLAMVQLPFYVDLNRQIAYQQ